MGDFRKYTNIDLSRRSASAGTALHQPAPTPDIRQKPPKSQFGPQTPMPQLLDVVFGVFNNREQAEEEERTQHEKRQARAHAKLIAVAVSHALRPQDNPRGPRRSNSPSGGKTNKGECYMCESTGHWARDCQKEAPRAMPSLQTNRSLEEGLPSVPKGNRGLLLPRWPCWMTEVAWGFWRLPPTRCLSPLRSPR